MKLTLADLRDSWVAWLGVSVAFIVTNFALALSVLAIVSATDAFAAGITSPDERDQIRTEAILNVVLCSLVGMAVIGAATGLVISSRRSSLARLLLAGAEPRQVTRLLSGQVAATSLAGAVVGDLVAFALIQRVLDIVSDDRSLTPIPASYALLPVIATNLACVALAVIGGLRQVSRASRIPPVEALREATSGGTHSEGKARAVLRGFRFALCFGLVALMVVMVDPIVRNAGKDGVGQAAQMAFLAIPIAGLGIATVLPWLLGPLTRAWTRAVPTRSAAWHLARHTAVAKADRLARSVTPVMFAIGLIFGLMAAGDTFGKILEARGITLEGSSVTSLLTILGLPLLVAVSGSVGNLVMMSRQRSAELALDGVIGATPRQQLLVAAFEALIITVTSVLLGLVMSAIGGIVLVRGLSAIMGEVDLVMSPGVLALAAVVCWVIVTAATILPIVRTLREPAPKVIARLVAA